MLLVRCEVEKVTDRGFSANSKEGIVALVTCLECGTEVSNAAAACPKCGHPVKATPAGGLNLKDPVHVVGIALVVIIVFGILVAVVQAIASRNVYP